MPRKQTNGERHHATLVYPKHQCNPEDLLTFIEMHGFTDDWRELGMTDDDLLALQVMMMATPRQGKVVSGTGGLRKLRFAPAKSSHGKRGGCRVCYVYFEEHHTILLVVVYSKSEQDDLSSEDKGVIKKVIERQQKAFDEGRLS